jgi:hypothetical protein
MGAGLGLLGLAGFGLAAAGLAQVVIFGGVLFLLSATFIFNGKIKNIFNDFQKLTAELKFVPAPWTRFAAFTALTLGFLLALTPPIEDFDALFYHLTVPMWWMRDGGVSSIAIPHYWFPQIGEGMFLWVLAFGLDSSAHLIHLTWLVLSVLLLWHWADQLWGKREAWNSILLLLTMPSLLWLAGWAYTDYILTFSGIAAIYSMWKWQSEKNLRWLILAAIFSGFAIGVKYTGFIIPLTGGILALYWTNDKILGRLKNGSIFSLVTLTVASPWYVRNWAWMGNPFYPFAFGGLYWDDFLAKAYSGVGTGIGLDLTKLFMLPLTATLGTEDANFFDGRIGPFYLILLPFTLYAVWSEYKNNSKARTALFGLGFYTFIGFGFWVFGVINTAHLLQTRLLFPALIPTALFAVIGIRFIEKLDTPQFKAGFIFNTLFALAIGMNLFNLSLHVVTRNPVGVALGMVTRQEYYASRQPAYAEALTLMEEAPWNSKTLLLFEPRSYGMNGFVQPDAINANFEHAEHLYESPEKILAAWKSAGYTHILISKRGAELTVAQKPELNKKLILLTGQLILSRHSLTGEYTLYQIP